MSAVLRPISRLSLSESLYRQLKDRIVCGAYRPGERLPSERTLSEDTGINRGAVREAVKRLQQAGLVAVRQGGNHEVLDYRREAGPELLPSLLIDGKGMFQLKVVRDLMAMRSTLAPEIAAAAALKGGAALQARLQAVCNEMAQERTHVAELQRLALDFWQHVVDASDNVAYQLCFNAMRKSYLKAWKAMTVVMAEEFQDLVHLQALIDAVRQGDADAARLAARRHVDIGEQAIARWFKETT